jgi:FkbM family methyltransferase
MRRAERAPARRPERVIHGLDRQDDTTFGAFAPAGVVRWVLDRTRTLPDSWPARRYAYTLRRIAVQALKGAPVDAEALGARMRLYPANNVCEKRILFTPQYFDPEERAILAERVTEGFHFVDVGANVGGYALYVAGIAGAGARIVAVEPDPEIFDRLVYNIRQNPFGSIKAIACAVADKAGEITLFVDTRNRGETGFKVGSGRLASIRVPAMALLDLVQEERLERIDALKLDVEGAADLILEPFFRDAPESLHPTLLIIEDGGGRWQMDLPRLLDRLGYRLIARTRLNLVLERPTAVPRAAAGSAPRAEASPPPA